MSPARITLACLDMAGTTVRDDGAVERAFLDALARVGIGPGHPGREAMLDEVRATMGTSKIEVFRSLLGDEGDARTANDAFEEAYAHCLDAGGVVPLPGAQDAIACFRRNGVRVALLTGFSAPTRDRLVAALGWQEAADLLLCPAEAGRGRPYPDLVLAAALRLGVDDVANIAVVGDTAADMRSGRRAGAGHVIGVLTGADGAERLLDAGATHLLASIADLPGLLGLADP